MVSPKQLLSTIESTLLSSSPPSPSDRIELMHAVRSSLSSLQNLLSYPPPRPADRTEVQSKEVRLPTSPPISLDDQDVHLALKLSDDLHLNEIDCVRLLVSANQEWGLLGREPLEILRLATGLWYTERRDLITALYTLLRAVVLDQDLEGDLVADIQKYLEDLLNAGLRQRLITLIKELNWEEPAGLGGPNAERYIIDARGAIVERRAVVCRERLILSHCLVLSALVVRTSPKDIKDIFSGLKDSAAELNGCTDTSKYQITYGILFSLVIAFTSDALSTVPEKVSVLSRDVSFRQEFQDIVMAPVNDPNISGFVDCVRLAWSVHLMLVQEGVTTRNTISSASSKDLQNISSCLEVIFSNNVFQFFMEKVLRTAAYQNDDEDMTYMYNAYLHKLMTIFLSEPLARDKVKEVKEKVMTTLSPYRMGGPHGFSHLDNINAGHAAEVDRQPFISLLEFISEIYQKEPELLSGNDVLWTFVNFAGEDHSNFHTLVAFLKMLGALACSQEGSSKVFELLQGKTFRSVSWSTLFDCLSIYADKFKQTLQSTGSLLPEFPEGDAKALVAYLTVLRKVVENGNPIDRKNWFTDIEPLFKLLSYENVPPFLKGALRDAIAVFIRVSPLMKDTIWGYLEQYDLPVVVGPQVVNTAQPMSTQVYDMQFELNEIEARREYYPSTISFIKLLNALIAEEKDFSDGGRRFVGIFRFIYDQVFGPFPQRAYADLSEKWQLVVACLHHFRMILTTYEITIEDIESVADRSQLSTVQQPAQHQLHLPVVELMKDFMSGKTVFRNIMGILSPGVNAIITERTSQIYGDLLEKAVNLSLEIIFLILGKDIQLADYWHPLYQPLDVILSQDHNQIVALLEYVRYDLQPLIQQCSIKIMSSLSSRMVGLVQLLLKSNAASSLVEDYASCLEIRAQESQIVDNSSDDLGVLILQLLIDNISRPAPNVTHLLLKFDLDTPIEHTVLQPRFNYSCLKVILDMLDKLLKPDVNALLHEFEFQLLYELCVDELTSGPMMDLLSNKRYHFFVKHLETIGIAPLPKRNSAQALRTSSLHQRAWLLKLLTVELHSGDMTDSSHRETCRKILVYMFGQEMNELEGDHDIASSFALQNRDNTGTGTISKSKALELLDIIQFRAPEATLDYSQVVSNTKCSMLAEEILRSSVSEKDGVYYYSERGDRLINLTSFRDKLWQMSSFGNELELNDLREMVQQLLRWAWKYNRNLEEQAAQLHMLTGWSQIVEISASRRLSSLENRTEVLFQLLDASISASASPDCSLKMALLLTQVALTCMAKLRDDRYLYPAGLNSDAVTCLDAIMFKQLSNGACLSILFKLTLALLRHDSSEALRRRQYALLLSYFQYCQHVLDPDVPKRMLQLLLGTNQDSEDMDLEKIDKEQEELARSNFSILRKEAQAILDLVIKDATQGSESGKTISHFVLDALICIDHEKFFLNQLQSRGFLRSCLMSISNFSHQDVRRTMETLQRACTLEAELALVLRISHKYGKAGAQVLSSMGTLENLASCKALYMPLKGSLRRAETRFGRELPANADKQQVIVAPVLRLVLSLTSLVDASEFFEVKNKIVREAIEFVKAHPSLFDRALQENIFEVDDLMMELINLSVGILSKVWPYEENDEFGFVQGLFRMMCDMFSQDSESFSSVSPGLSPLNQRRSELKKYHIGFRLSSYLYFQVTKKSLRLQVSDDQSAYHKFGGKQQPTLALLGHFLNTVTSALERAADEKSLLLNKIQDINELSRQEVDGIINTYTEKTRVSTSDNTNTRRYIAMVEMCQIVGDRDQLVTLLLLLAENVLNVILAHFQDTSLMAGTNDTTKLITCTSDVESKQDLSSLCGKLLPILERLELLNEDKIGQSLKVFGRLVTSLKELTIRKLAS
ncbi:nuclear pore complex protein NUP205-like [Chenopodium quinoa]|uniref:nuclear pore complex protein NUP205-like n=1 Tax=Chenopodium quinoa TaxID=63459 RepID=UPI000B799755|nr:nuclear pore complex protein NUP205-like [Chenopodium quinoa]